MAKEKLKQGEKNHAQYLIIFCLHFLVYFGCNKPIQPEVPVFVAPVLHYELDHFLGDPLSGPRSGNLLVQQSDPAISITLTFLALEHMPTELLGPLEADTRLILSSLEGEPVTSITRLTRGGRSGSVDDVSEFLGNFEQENFGTFVRLKVLNSTILTGTTTCVRVKKAESIADEASGSIEIQVYLSPITDPIMVSEQPANKSLEIALIQSGEIYLDDTQSNTQKEEVKINQVTQESQSLVPFVESVILKPIAFQDKIDFAIVLPYLWNDSDAEAVAIVVQVQQPKLGEQTDIEYNRALSQCLADIKRHGADIDLSGSAYPTGSLKPDFALAQKLLMSSGEKRKALLYLASVYPADFTGDVALSVELGHQYSLANHVIKMIQSSSDPNNSDLGWLMEKASYIFFADLLNKGQATLDVEGILTYHTGEVGRHGSLLLELASRAQNLEDFHNLLLQENLVYLNDASPSARIRAYDWLAAREKAPPGYNPLASKEERRAALTKNAEKLLRDDKSN